MAPCELAIVIPALNEQETIGEVIMSASPFGDVIVVDDGSTDSTVEIALNKKARVVRHEKNRGYDAALNSGMMAAVDAGYKYALTMDADGEHTSEALSAAVQLIREKSPILFIGNRGSCRRLSEFVVACYFRLRTGINDPLCGLKGYSVHVIRERGAFSTFESIGTEMAFYLARNGEKVEEIDITIKDRVDESRFGPSLSANWKIFKALTRLLVFDLRLRSVRN